MPSEPKQLPLPPPPLPCTHRDLSGTARGEATRTRARPDPSSPPVADAAAADRPVSVAPIRPPQPIGAGSAPGAPGSGTDLAAAA